MFDFNCPPHWKIFKLRQILKPVSEKNRPDMALLSVTREQGVIIRNIESKEENHNVIPQDLSNYKVVRKGQFVINKMKAWQGSCGISNYDGIVSPAYYVFELNFSNKKFFNYAIRSRIYADFFAQFSKGIRVDQWDLPLQAIKNIPFHVPPLVEQEKIVRYLDKKTAQISTFLDAKKKEVALLDELKRSIIAEAVTKELHNDISHWKKIKLKYLAKIYNGNSIIEEKKLPYLEVKYLRGVAEKKIVDSGSFISAGTKIILVDGENSGEIFIAPEDGYLGSTFRVLKISESVNEDFLIYCIHSQKEFYRDQKKGSAIPHLDKKLFFATKILVPTLEEQKEIAAYLDARCEKIEKLIAALQEEIKNVEELKVSIISEVVTGKKDVRGLI